jgi:hypothetical protein
MFLTIVPGHLVGGRARPQALQSRVHPHLVEPSNSVSNVHCNAFVHIVAVAYSARALILAPTLAALPKVSVYLALCLLHFLFHLFPNHRTLRL